MNKWHMIWVGKANKTLLQQIEKAVDRFETRYKSAPSVIRVNPDVLSSVSEKDKIELDKIRKIVPIKTRSTLGKNTIWVGYVFTS